MKVWNKLLVHVAWSGMIFPSFQAAASPVGGQAHEGPPSTTAQANLETLPDSPGTTRAQTQDQSSPNPPNNPRPETEAQPSAPPQEEQSPASQPQSQSSQ